MDTEALRDRYRPTDVRVLFVGESPPAGGTFFYAANSNLYYATKDAFETGVPDLLSDADFLDDFEALGCFLDDLCLEPVNHLKGTAELEAQREAERKRGEEPLAERIRTDDPQAVVIVMKGIAANVRSAMVTANAGDLPERAFPFARFHSRAGRSTPRPTLPTSPPTFKTCAMPASSAGLGGGSRHAFGLHHQTPSRLRRLSAWRSSIPSASPPEPNSSCWDGC